MFRPIRLGLIAVWTCVSVLALDPNLALSQYQKQLWQVEQGLPRNYVMAVLPTRDGYLLVATEEGLARFDGLRFTPFETTPPLKLSQRWILSMIAARDGSTWVGTFDGWLYQFKGHELASRYFAGASVFTILQDTAGTIWASTRDGVIRSSGAQFQRVPGLAAPPDMAWNTLARDSDGAVWIVTVDGLFRSANGVISRVLTNHNPLGEVLSVLCDRKGIVWAGGSKGLASFGQARSGANISLHSGVPGPVVALLSDRDGQLWAGTWGSGVCRLDSRGAGCWSAREGLADDYVRTLYEDGEGNVWIGTRTGGLSRWKDSLIVPYGVPEGLHGEFASTVAPDSRGDLWFGTWRGGLYKRIHHTFVEEPTPLPRLYCTIRALAFDRSGNPWIGNWEGLFGYNGRKYEQYSGPDSSIHHVSAILFDSEKRLWVGTSENGVFLFPGGRPSPENTAYLNGTEVTALFEDSRHRIWVGTTDGMGRFEGKSLKYQPIAAAKDSISSVPEDAKGRVWGAALSGTLYVISGDSVAAIRARNGLPVQPLYRVINDEAGAYWISSRDGILELRGSQVDDVLAGRRQRLDVVVHQQEDGMRTIECHRLSQPAGGRDREGLIWFPTTRGFVSIDPRRRRSVPMPQVAVEEVRADGRVLPEEPEFELGPATHSLEIRYTGLNFSSPAEIRFRYRMEGFDPDWIEAGTERTAHYNHLPPARHRFLVEARLPGGRWSPAPAAIEIDQIPTFYQRVPFLLLLAACIAAVVVGTFRWRVHVIRGRYALVTAERNRIAREWHDTLLAGFSAISWQLEQTASQIRDFPEAATETVKLALRMVHHYRAEARSVIWDLREKQNEGETLGDAISSVVERVTAGAGIHSNVDVAGPSTHLPREMERNILRICQEASSNAKRHGQATRIDVRLEYQQRGLFLRVQDDGKGFDPKTADNTPSGHFGMAVMRERAERFGGELHVTSRPGSGTTVEASIPLPEKMGSV
jgi:ligand-binding sensor domain-containing protein/two-component sensor histidine kinase